jgi:hypothetical protein
VSWIVERWRHLFLKRVDPRTLAAVRICTGLQVFLILAERIPLAGDALSDAGWLASEASREIMHHQHWSILHWVGDPTAVTAIVALGALTALALMAGFWSRTSAWLTFAILASVQVRNPNMLYGGDAGIRALAFYVAISDCGAAWSIDGLRSRRRSIGEALREGRIPIALRRPVRLVGVWAQRLIQLQVVFIYWGSGVAKYAGQSWHEGTALWYGLVNPMYSRGYPVAMPLFSALQPVWRLATWATATWQFMFPLLLLHRYPRYLALGYGLIFSSGIVLMLRVEWWGTIMLVYYLAFVSERRVKAVTTKTVRYLRHRLWDSRLSLQFDPTDARGRLLASWIAALDVLRLVRIETCDDRFRLKDSEGKALTGREGFRALANVVPLLTPIAILAALPGGMAVLSAGYATYEKRVTAGG